MRSKWLDNRVGLHLWCMPGADQRSGPTQRTRPSWSLHGSLGGYGVCFGVRRLAAAFESGSKLPHSKPQRRGPEVRPYEERRHSCRVDLRFP